MNLFKLQTDFQPPPSEGGAEPVLQNVPKRNIRAAGPQRRRQDHHHVHADRLPAGEFGGRHRPRPLDTDQHGGGSGLDGTVPAVQHPVQLAHRGRASVLFRQSSFRLNVFRF